MIENHGVGCGFSFYRAVFLSGGVSVKPYKVLSKR